jgi:endonuclease/exonuclease/phosphatase family metal-dependent hydrolase
VLWKPDVLDVQSVENLFTSGAEAASFPRPPLTWKTTVTARAAELRVVAVHLKAGARAADEQARITALAALEQNIHNDSATLLLGDFNEALSDPRSAEAFAPFTGDRYRVQTLALADAGVVTFLPAHLYFDHIVSTVALDAGTVTIPPLDTTVSGYQQNVSDHLPVVLDVAF